MQEQNSGYGAPLGMHVGTRQASDSYVGLDSVQGGPNQFDVAFQIR